MTRALHGVSHKIGQKAPRFLQEGGTTTRSLLPSIHFTPIGHQVLSIHDGSYNMRHVFSSPVFALAMSVSSVMLYSFLVYQFSLPALVSALLSSSAPENSPSTSIDATWHPPNTTWINDLSDVINGTGVHGFIFNNSNPKNVAYGGYNWCNMPHVRQSEYVIPAPEYELEYVELVRQIPWMRV